MTESKRCKGGNSGKVDRVDRISSLPDEILADVLSFLPTKDAVATSILSRRWKFVWTQVPVVDVGVEIYYQPLWNHTHFQNFFSNFLLLNKVPHLRSCRLHVPCKIDNVHAWIEDIGKREVKDMYLSVLGFVKLPSSVFTCEKLVSLTLRGGIHIDVPASVHLPNLRVVKLVTLFELKGESSLSLLASRCPALEELVIDRCKLSDSEELHVRSSTLKKLQIKRLIGRCGLVVFDAPKLEYLMLLNFCMSGYDGSDLSSLREAVIDFNGFFYSESNTLLNSLSTINTLTLVSRFSNNLTTLQLRWSKCKHVRYFINHLLPDCHKLTCLKFGICKSCWCIVPALLQRTPNLVNLVVACAPIESFVDCNEPHVIDVPSCLLHKIKVVEIRDFNDSDEAMTTASYLFMNGRVLNEMKIYCSRMLWPAEELRKKLMAFPRGSHTCRIQFVHDPCRSGTD